LILKCLNLKSDLDLGLNISFEVRCAVATKASSVVRALKLSNVDLG